MHLWDLIDQEIFSHVDQTTGVADYHPALRLSHDPAGSQANGVIWYHWIKGPPSLTAEVSMSVLSCPSLESN